MCVFENGQKAYYTKLRSAPLSFLKIYLRDTVLDGCLSSGKHCGRAQSIMIGHADVQFLCMSDVYVPLASVCI